ncbi:MAG: hypothetical protein HY811_09825 [Planctomycetes bacterium]|nr:hypothetical protein [Planctomycetota bacterium]
MNNDITYTQKLIYINGLNSAIGNVDIGPFVIRKLSEHELAKIFRAKKVSQIIKCYEDGSKECVTSEAITPTGFVKEARWDDQHAETINILSKAWCVEIKNDSGWETLSGLHAFSVGRNPCSWAIMALLRMTRSGYIALADEIEVRYYNNTPTTSRLCAGTQSLLPGDFHSYLIDEEHKNKLITLTKLLWESFKQLPQNPQSDILNALYCFVRAPTSGLFFDVIVDLWTCAEAMCGISEMELSHKLCEKMSVLSIKDNEKMYDIFQIYKDLYKTRNEWVHGSANLVQLAYTNFAEMIEQINKLEGIIRIALIRYLVLRLIKNMSRKELHKELQEAVFDSQKRDNLLNEAQIQ